MAKGNRTGKGGFREHPENRHTGGNKPLARIPDILRRIGTQTAPEIALKEVREKYKLDCKTDMIELVMWAVFDSAIHGEAWAVTFIADRTEGKVADNVSIEGDQSQRIQFYLPANGRDMHLQPIGEASE